MLDITYFVAVVIYRTYTKMMATCSLLLIITRLPSTIMYPCVFGKLLAKKNIFKFGA